MGLVSGLVDGAVLIFSLVLVAAVPLIDAQVLFADWYPPQLVELKRWYAEEYGDYLTKEKPHFFLGLVWIEICFLWPLSIANVYGIIRRKSWAGITSLMVGVSTATSMAAIMAELLGSGRASEKLLQMYVPFAGFALLAILKGLFSRPRRATVASSHSASTRKKRA